VADGKLKGVANGRVNDYGAFGNFKRRGAKKMSGRLVLNRSEVRLRGGRMNLQERQRMSSPKTKNKHVLKNV
jgi:hypothetical protein